MTFFSLKEFLLWIPAGRGLLFPLKRLLSMVFLRSEETTFQDAGIGEEEMSPDLWNKCLYNQYIFMEAYSYLF